MDEYKNKNEDATTAGESVEEYGFAQPSLKSNILKLVTETNDEKLLKLVWSVLQENSLASKPIHLSNHIQAIFDTYPETMKKLAQ